MKTTNLRKSLKRRRRKRLLSQLKLLRPSSKLNHLARMKKLNLPAPQPRKRQRRLRFPFKLRSRPKLLLYLPLKLSQQQHR